MQKVQVILVDDLDGGDAEETVSFQLDGVQYEIDLSTDNAARLRDSLTTYVGAARRMGGRSTAKGRTRSGGSSNGQASSNEVRAWARQHGVEVNDRGRVPADVTRQYEAAQRRRQTAPEEAGNEPQETTEGATVTEMPRAPRKAAKAAPATQVRKPAAKRPGRKAEKTAAGETR